MIAPLPATQMARNTIGERARQQHFPSLTGVHQLHPSLAQAGGQRMPQQPAQLIERVMA